MSMVFELQGINSMNEQVHVEIILSQHQEPPKLTGTCAGKPIGYVETSCGTIAWGNLSNRPRNGLR